MNPALIVAFNRKKALALRALRPCTLLWGTNQVLAREGVAKESQEFMSGGMVTRLRCRFYVLRELLEEAPAIDTVFKIDGRGDEGWRLEQIRGRSPNDAEWIFECTEEHR